MIDYKAVRRQAIKAYRKALADGRHPYLPVLDEIIRDVDTRGEILLGTMEIPMHMIAGTKTSGRQNAFACNFLPLLSAKSEFATKWIYLYDIQMTEGFNDPIKVFEYMHRFYVLEGNKRVSVMKYLNGDSILADVVRILPEKSDDRANRIYDEFLDFYRVTDYYGIEFTETGRYLKLAVLFGQNLINLWPAGARRILKNTFVYFGVLLADSGGCPPGFSAGDIFLFYLQKYGISSLEKNAPSAVKADIEKIRAEMNGKFRRKTIQAVSSHVFSSCCKHIGLSNSLKKPPDAPAKKSGNIPTGSLPSEGRSPLKVLAVSDKADNSIWDGTSLDKLKDIDLIISCGDLSAAYLEYLVTMSNAPLFYVAGNHDQGFEFWPPEGCEDIGGRLVRHEGLRILGLDGSMGYSKGRYQYTEQEMQRRIRKLNRTIRHAGGVDLLVTHVPPAAHGDMQDVAHQGFECFNEILLKYEPVLMLHGHVHREYDPRLPLELTHESGTRILNCCGSIFIEI